MSLIERLNRAIDVEYDSKNAEIDSQLELPLEDRVLKGDTISDITANFVDSNFQGGSSEIIFNSVKVTCPDNISKFREGSPVKLSGYGHSFVLDVVEDNDENMTLQIGYGIGSISRNYNNTKGWQIDNAKVDIRDIVKQSTYILANDSTKLNSLTNIFEGKSHPQFDDEKKDIARRYIENAKLDKTQKEAYIYAYSAKNFYLVQGPPGSGKTWLLAHLAVEFAKEGKKVLITAFTHTAINNALQKTSSLSGYPHIIKVGKKYQTEGLNNEGSTAKNVTDFSRSGYTNTSKGIIVGATCYAPYTKKLSFMDWDIVIIDEAGQLTIPLAIAAMVKGEKYILIGDHKQLPPIVAENHKDIEFTKSIFEHLFKYNEGIMLDITYRMNRHINKFPSRQFYNDKLKPHTNNENWILNIDNHFQKHQDILDINKPEVLFCHNHYSNQPRSEFEAKLISELLEEYINNGLNGSDIAIITPYRAQVRQIRKYISKLNAYQKIKNDLLLDTVERMQGQERNVIIYSLAISDPIKAKQRLDFVFNPNRFNVAITRAKKKRIVIGAQSMFHFEINDTIIKPLIKNFEDFYSMSTILHENPDVNGLF
ncbi:MAG: AAA family ATPase [Bacteroidales bacterium]|nr:AAA family ATPase [Bacteroidales bacterium]